MMTVRSLFCGLGGEDRCALLVGVTTKSTNRAAVNNVCPASWYYVLKKEAARLGKKCPMSLFRFRGLPAKPIAEAAQVPCVGRDAKGGGHHALATAPANSDAA